jgi:hypothetical protein
VAHLANISPEDGSSIGILVRHYSSFLFNQTLSAHTLSFPCFSSPDTHMEYVVIVMFDDIRLLDWVSWNPDEERKCSW